MAAAPGYRYAAKMASVMIVDDTTDACQALAKFLEKCGHEVTCHPNGKDALGAVISKLPDVVILDLFMPDLDGASFLEVVRSYLRLQSLPVVVLTGLPESPMVDRARHLKVNAVLVKGKATLDEIADAVRQELHRVPG